MESILLVDDDELVRALLEAQLDTLGFRVRSAGDAAAALRELAHHDDVDLLMTDVTLPGVMDGYGLAERLHAERPDVPILFISGGPAREGGAPRGAITHHLEKPFRMTELEACVRSLLQQGCAQRSVES